MHYHRWYRNGDPHVVRVSMPGHVNLTGRTFGELTVLHRVPGAWYCRCTCGATTTVPAGSLNSGTTATCGNRAIHNRRDDAGYNAAHQRVRNDRGPISSHPCRDCGGQAAHWSYDHDDPEELHDHNISSSPVAYSLNPDHYSPRCVPCHKRYDLDRTDAA